MRSRGLLAGVPGAAQGTVEAVGRSPNRPRPGLQVWTKQPLLLQLVRPGSVIAYDDGGMDDKLLYTSTAAWWFAGVCVCMSVHIVYPSRSVSDDEIAEPTGELTKLSREQEAAPLSD